MKTSQRLFIIIFSTVLSLLLTACASTVSSQVSRFHDWSGQYNHASFVIEKTAEQENDPEFAHYAAALSKQLKIAGFQEASVPSDISQAMNTLPAIRLQLKYQTILSDYQFFMHRDDPFWLHHYSRFRLGPGLHSGLYRSPFWNTDPRGRQLWWYPGLNGDYRTNYLHQIEIKITAADSGKTLATIRASTEQSNPEISLQMPYLISSALQDFPGVNGSSTTVVLPAALATKPAVLPAAEPISK